MKLAVPGIKFNTCLRFMLTHARTLGRILIYSSEKVIAEN
jgi:hypothetical protein